MNLKEKPFLFCSFHPSDYESYNSKYISLIKLKKDVKLFFMISNITDIRINSAFINFFNINKTNLSFINNNKVNKFKNKLISKNFDGWFSSIEDKIAIEVALLNNNEIYECKQINNFNSNWNFIYNENIDDSYLNFGKKYYICTINKPCILLINQEFKNNIDIFKSKSLSKNLLPSSVFEVILKNAYIIYFDENNKILDIDNILQKYIK